MSAVAVKGKSARRAAVKFLHGHHIHAYCNIRTNQILYTLENKLMNASLKQLPDIGANYHPPTIRRDMWRRLWTVQLPLTKEGARQGLDAFQKLREYRKLHELYWEPPYTLTHPHNESQVKSMQKKLERRGGSKVDTVYDLIKHKKMKIRARMVMDQKANSIADLAAVLLEQDKIGADTYEEVKGNHERNRDLEVRSMVRLSQESALGQDAHLRIYLLKLHKQLKAAPIGSRTKLRLRIASVKLHADKMTFAAAAVQEAKQKAEADGKTLPTPPAPTTASENSSGEAAPLSPARTAAYVRSLTTLLAPYLPSYPPTLDVVNAPQHQRSPWAIRQRKLSSTPVFTTHGVQVSWANTLDAEYAQAWPSAVQHTRMGFVRNQGRLPASQGVVDEAEEEILDADHADIEAADPQPRAVPRAVVLADLRKRALNAIAPGSVLARVARAREAPAADAKA